MKASEYRDRANEYLVRIVSKRAHLFTAGDLIWLTAFINVPDPLFGSSDLESRLDSLRRLEAQLVEREQEAA